MIRGNRATRPDISDLSANENPFSPSPNAIRALIDQAATANRYPDRDGVALKTTLSVKLGIARDHIILGNGSCEILDLVARACLKPGGEAVLGWPSFPTYRSVVTRAGASVVSVPLAEHAYDLDAMAARIGAQTTLAIVANPNNPTGLSIGQAALDRFLDRLPAQVVVVLDEAYREYVWRPDFPDSLAYVAAGRPVVVVRSLSKAYGLAGLRIGYAVAPPVLARRIDAERQHFNTNSMAQAAAVAALADADHLAQCVAANAAGLSWLKAQLSALGLFYLPSEANFLLVRVGNGREVHARLKDRGVLVKELDAVGLPDCIRVSVGRPHENERFIRALSAVLAGAGTTSAESKECVTW
ncbi:histidinol-phosphate transaminase [Methylovirgula sp. HY1]|uniref:histidinol-phosphate transaminase n=1 Tax=Methylovirgula sp. HY1 TaxID=2822761 RepID=UPI001C7921DE|nr:histidinol-phosphate transaminase [Methylovirgula sp. HY1]QXX74311.1 Putative phenylalanine aminotransferase [Methylovirgula sp. HY1]